MEYTIYTISQVVVKGKMKEKKRKALETDDYNEVKQSVKKLRKKKFDIIIITNKDGEVVEKYNLVRNSYRLNIAVATPIFINQTNQ